MFFINRNYFLKASFVIVLENKKKYKKNSCEGFCQRIKTSAGRGSGTEGVLSYT